MLTHAAVVRDQPQIIRRTDDRKLKDERMGGHCDRRTRRFGWRWKNLNPRARTTPGTLQAESTEAVFATDLRRPHKNCGLDFIGDPRPLSRIKCRTRLDRNDPLAAKREHDTAAFARERKIELVRIGFPTIKLARATDALVEKQSQFAGIETRPRLTQKIFRHHCPRLEPSRLGIDRGGSVVVPRGALL